MTQTINTTKTGIAPSKTKGHKTELLAVKNLLYALSYAPEKHERIYYFLLLDAEKEAAFKAALTADAPFNLKDYATIIASGHGDPPEDLKEQLRIKYNAIL
jgi:hypothetical protein